jgi:hypothetical protein
MMTTTRYSLLCAVMICCAQIAASQEAKAPPPTEEDSRLARIVERWIESNETEHDHVLREVMRGSEQKIEDDFEVWYTRLGGDENGWDRARLQRKSAGEIFDRVAQHLEVFGPVLTRDQFLTYAKTHWPEDKSGTWREPQPFNAVQEADELFRRLDRDRDGYLGATEMAPPLRTELNRWDRNEDKWITPDEYRYYFARRLDRVYRDTQQRSEKRLPALEIKIEDDPERIIVPRPGKLPLGLPAWFEQVDTDVDGQVALFEWRAAGWPVEQFPSLDANDDGFLEPQEILKLLATTDRTGARPFGFLLQMRPQSVNDKSKS